MYVNVQMMNVALPGFLEPVSIFDIEVLLDGVPQKYCVAADTEAGYVDVYDTERGDKIKLDFRHAPVTIKKHGHVEIRRRAA